jgi:hypothetical protein
MRLLKNRQDKTRQKFAKATRVDRRVAGSAHLAIYENAGPICTPLSAGADKNAPSPRV